MALTNAQKQARWRERHILKRRNAQLLANLLMRQNVTDAQIEDVAVMLTSFFNREGIRILRRELRRLTESRKDGSVSHYLSASFAAQARAMENEQEAWERDHPGAEYPEHECGLNDREWTNLARWRRQRGRKHIRNSTPPSD